jgi:tetratricopeptide (TPR) repeat protein
VWTGAVFSLVALAILAGSIGWIVRDQEARQAAMIVQADLAIQEATRFQEQGNWPEALSAVKRAEGILAVGVLPEWEHRVQECRRDLEMMLKLEEIRLDSGAGRDSRDYLEERGPTYAVAFRDYGIDVAVLEPPDAGQRIQTKSKSIRDELIATLDDWAFLVCGPTPQRTRLLAVSRAADPDAWRNQLRDALERGDGNELREMAVSAHVLELPSSSLKLFGDYLFKRGDVEEAVALLRGAQPAHVADFWINESLAVWLQWTKPPALDEAIGFYRAALALRPKTAAVYGGLGYALLSRGRSNEAEAAFRNAIEFKPDFSEAHAGLVRAFLEQERPAEAREACARAVELLAGNAWGLNRLTWRLVTPADPRIRHAVPVVELAKQAIQRLPVEGSFWNTLGVAHYRAGNWKEAISTLEQAMVLREGGDSFDWFFLAMAHWQLGDQARARRWYAPAVLCIEKDQPIHAELGRFRVEAAALLGLPEHLPQRQQLKPDDAEIYSLALEAAAGTAADRAGTIEPQPGMVGLWVGRGHAYLRRREWDKANADFEKALQAQPRTRAVWDRIAWLLATNWDADPAHASRAVEVAEEAIALGPLHDGRRLSLAWAYSHAGRWKEALAAAQEALTLRDGGDCADWFLLAMLHARLGDKDKAREWYDRACLLMMERSHPDWPGFRAEAEDVLEIKRK